MRDIYEIALSQVKGIGPVAHRKIIEELGSAEAFFKLTAKELHSLNIEPFNTKELIAKSKEAHKKNVSLGVSMVCYGDKEYPSNLMIASSPPPYLFYVGDITLASNAKKMAVVGTRHNTAYGKSVTEQIVEAAVKDNVVVVSGLATGIDAIAHTETLEAGGKTVAIIGSGFMYQYPKRNSRLYHDIVEQGGLIISEYLPYMEPLATNFPRRNRVVAGIADCVLVVESKCKGGSLITADYGVELSKEIFAVPGPITSENSGGCNKLISEGANVILQGYSDIRSSMGWDVVLKDEEILIEDNVYLAEEKSQAEVFAGIKLTSNDEKIVTYLRENGQAHIDLLCKDLSLTNSIVLTRLTVMELKGVVHSLPGMRYSL